MTRSESTDTKCQPVSRNKNPFVIPSSKNEKSSQKSNRIQSKTTQSDSRHTKFTSGQYSDLDDIEDFKQTPARGRCSP